MRKHNRILSQKPSSLPQSRSKGYLDRGCIIYYESVVFFALDSDTAIDIRLNKHAVTALHHDLTDVYRAEITCIAQLRNTLRLKKS